MSFIAKSIFSYFYPKKNQNISKDTINNKNNLQNLFKTTKKTNQVKIFSTTENKQKSGIFSFNENKRENKINDSDNINIGFPKKYLFNDNPYKIINKNRDSTLGINFNGFGTIKSDNQNCIFMSITALPEYSYSSNEELRLADIEKKLTGDINFYKINNTSINENGNVNIKIKDKINNIFTNNQMLNVNETIHLKFKNEDNIFTHKLDNSKSPFVNLINNNNNLQKLDNNVFTYNDNINKKELINNTNPFSFNNTNRINNNQKYLFQNNSLFNSNSNISSKNTTISFNDNNNYNKLSYEDITNPLNNIDINKLFSEKEKLSKVLNEAIIKEKTVKDFLLDLDNEYKSSEIININENDSINYGEKNIDNGITLSQRNINEYNKYDFSYLSPIKSRKEIPLYKMELELDEKDNLYNYTNSCSKIKQIYNDYEQNKNNYNKNNYLGNKTYKKAYENIESNKKSKNEKIFSKTFSNGFPKFNSNYNQNGIFLGRNEELYQRNLMKLDKLSLNEINNKNNNNYETFLKDNQKDEFRFNEEINEENKINFSLLNKNKLNDSVSTISRQYVDLIIEYNLPDEKVKHYELYLNDVDQLMKVKALKKEITSKISIILKNKNKPYSISKITLLIPTQFLKEEDPLINYHLRSNNYTIQALISYSKKINNNLIPQNLAPKLDKPGYKCIPSISDLKNKTSEELKNVKNFKIYNKYGEVEFKEPINLLGVNLNNEIIIENKMIETGDKLDYWSVFKIYEFTTNEITLSNLKEKLNQNGGKFISYKNKELIWEYKAKY